MNQKTHKILKSFFIIAMFAFSIKALAVWQSPVSSPLVINTASPLNVGSVTQSKTGGLILGGLRVTGPALFDLSTRIGTAGTSPANSAVLDLTSTTQGFLAPRMTTTQRNNILVPDAGLEIYNTQTNQFEFYNGGAWIPVSAITTTFNSDITVNGNTVGRGGGNVSSNTVNGYQALMSNTTGHHNVADGIDSLYGNTTGYYNTAIGYNALPGNSIGHDNTSIGFQSLFSGSPGNYDTFIGSGSNTSSGGVSNATALGYNAVASNNAIALGSGASAATNEFALPNTVTNWKFRGMSYTLPSADGTTGQSLTTNGLGTLSWATNAATSIFSSDITVNGATIGKGGGSIVNNTGVGYQVLNSNTTGVNNTAIGYQTFVANTTGLNNTAIGSGVLQSNSSGQQNTGNGVSSLIGNTTGSNNTAVGFGSLYHNITGNNNTAFGYSADVTTDGLSNATAIGFNAKVGQSNSLVLGGTGGSAVNVGIGTTAPKAKLQVTAGDVYIDTIGSGIILRDTVSPYPCFRVTISASTIVRTLVTCP